MIVSLGIIWVTYVKFVKLSCASHVASIIMRGGKVSDVGAPFGVSSPI